MKRMLCLLLVLLLVPLAYAEDEMSLYLVGRRLIATEEGCTIHLMLYKENGIQYCIDAPDIALFDEAGQEITPVSSRLEAPINPVPQGNHYFPMTLYYVLPEGSKAADFQLRGFDGELYAEPAAELLNTDVGHIVQNGSDGVSLTAWMHRPDDENSEYYGYMLVCYLYDAEDHYLGNYVLTEAQVSTWCSGSSMPSVLEQATGLNEEVQQYYDLSFEPEGFYYVYENIPVTGLADDDVALSVSIDPYRCKSPLEPCAYAFESLGNNEWRVYYYLQNMSCEPYYADNIKLLFLDAEGNNGEYSSISTHYADHTFEAFYLLPYYSQVTLPEGFVPEKLSVITSGMNVEKAPYHAIDTGTWTLFESDGTYYVDASIPLAPGTDEYDYMMIFHAQDQEGNFLCCESAAPVDMRIEDDMIYIFLRVPYVPEGVEPKVKVFFYQNN